MDFKKIESIFLVAFLGLNVFLFSIFFQSRKEEGIIGNQEEKDPIEVRLAKDKITYEEELSADKPQGYFLAAEETIFPQVRITDENPNSPNGEGLTLPNQQTETILDDYLVNEKTLKEDVTAFLKDKKATHEAGEYTFLEKASSLTGNYPYLVATQTYEEIPFYDDTAKMQMTLRNVQGQVFQIEKVTYAHLDNIENLREKQDLISEKDALSTLYYNSKLPQESKINWVLLAYGRILKVREKNVYVPVWYVSITPPEEKTRVEQVNAVNNTIITGNTIPTVEN